MSYTNRASALIIVTVLGLSACGSGSVGTKIIPPPTPPPPPTGTMLLYGALDTGTEQIIADISVDLGPAEVFYNGAPGVFSQLRSGHLVGVVATTSPQGRTTASEIHFRANIVGPVDSVDAGAGSIVILDQQVFTDDETVLPLALSALTVGDVVQVSGYTDEFGVTVASRIERQQNVSEFELVGDVSNLDSASFTFEVNGLEVDYSAALTIDLPGGEVLDEMSVVVRGSRAADGELNAQMLESYDRDVSDHVGASVRGQGRITAAQSGESFSVNGFPVIMGGQRDYREGSSDDIAIGAKVRVEGQVLTGGAIQVHRVWFLHD